MPTLFFALYLVFLSLTVEATSSVFYNKQSQQQARLGRGAAFYFNYCSGCHALGYLRYEHAARLLGLSSTKAKRGEAGLVNGQTFSQAQSSYDPVLTSMPTEDAKIWFGMVPPDLSLIARVKGADWLLAYLKSFYPDSSRPFGSNNKLQINTAMPNVLAPLRRDQKSTLQPKSSLLFNQEGTLDLEAYDEALEDLVTFLVYVAEPARELRIAIGAYVIFFLLFFLVIAYQLKQSYKRLD